MYSINFSATKKRLSLSLHYNGDNSYLFVNSKVIIKLKAKDSEIVEDPICLETFQKTFLKVICKRPGCIVLFITLILIIMLLQLIIS